MNIKLRLFIILTLAIFNVHSSKLVKTKSSHNRMPKAVWFNNYEKYYLLNSYLQRLEQVEQMKKRIKEKEQELRNRIYREQLASRIRGSIIRDFLTIRF
jgi:hypothetical protein